MDVMMGARRLVLYCSDAVVAALEVRAGAVEAVIGGCL